MNPMRDLGPCQVVFNGVDLGKTMGGVIFRHTEESRPVVEDQSGVTEVDLIKVGATCEVEVPLTRVSLGQLAVVTGGATYTGTRLRVAVPVGISLLSLAKTLVLKPYIDGEATTDSTKWLTIYKAYARADYEVVFNNEGQRIYKVVFKAFPDSSNLVGTKPGLWVMGA